jgi:hypothetical protein
VAVMLPLSHKTHRWWWLQGDVLQTHVISPCIAWAERWRACVWGGEWVDEWRYGKAKHTQAHKAVPTLSLFFNGNVKRC